MRRIILATRGASNSIMGTELRKRISLINFSDDVKAGGVRKIVAKLHNKKKKT